MLHSAAVNRVMGATTEARTVAACVLGVLAVAGALPAQTDAAADDVASRGERGTRRRARGDLALAASLASSQEHHGNASR